MERDLETVREASAWDGETYLEDCCCIAVYSYYRTALHQMPQSSTSEMGISHTLVVSLERARLDSYWDGEYQLFLWMLFIGYASAHSNIQKHWLTAQLLKLISLVNMNFDFHGLKSILLEFLYAQELYGKDYEELWRTVT